MLYRGPSSSTSGSAAKISASSDAGRCWLNLPHTVGKSRSTSCIVPPMDQPEGGRAPQSGQPPTTGEQPSFPARPSSASPTSNPFSTPAAGDESAQSLTGGALPPPVDRLATGPLTREAAGALL